MSDNTRPGNRHNIGRVCAYAAPVSRAIHCLRGGLCWVLLVTAPMSAFGQAVGSPRLQKLMSAARSNDLAVATTAIDDIAKTPTAGSVVGLITLLSEGRADAVTERLVLALGTTRSDAALNALRETQRHRVASIRVATLSALTHFISRPDVEALVAQGLRDHDATVRAAAARALATMQARGQVDVLLLAFDRGVPEAADAIGTLASDAQLPAFNAFLTRKPLAHMLNGYRAWLVRDDVSETTKLSIVATLEEIASIAIKRFLQSVLDSGALANEANVQRAVATSIGRIRETPQTEPAP